MTLSKKLLLLSALMLASTPFVSAQTQPPAAPPGAAVGNSEQIRQMLQAFRQDRQAIIDQRRELVRKLQGLSEEERKALIADLRTMQKELAADHRALARAIREEMKQLRDQRRNPPTG